MSKKILLFIFCMILLPPISDFAESELLGEISKEEILEHFPDWQEVVASYFPKPEVIEKLQSIDSFIRIEVFLGTWCPDSKEHVSSYFKILGMADNPNIITNYMGIPRKKESRQPYILEKNIEKVPTFIVYIDDQEIGRIIEHPSKSIEEDLINIVSNSVTQ